MRVRVTEQHAQAIADLYENSNEQERYCLDFKAKHIETKLPDDLRPFVDKIYEETRGLVLDYKDLGNLVPRVRALVGASSTERKSQDHVEQTMGWLKRNRLFATVMVIGIIVVGISKVIEAVGKIRGEVGSLTTPVDPPATKAVPPYESTFRALAPGNENFQEVLRLFKDDLLAIRKRYSADRVQAENSRLVDHYTGERQKFLRDWRVKKSEGGSATVGKPVIGSAGSKAVRVAVACPDGMAMQAGSSVNSGGPGCSSPTENGDGAFATVKQVGEGRAGCTLSVKCRYPDEFVAAKVDAERAELREVATAP
jgi:hypothetical protein